MKKVKVLVVDDSAFMRKMISNILESHFRIQVVGTARNGIDALKKIETLNPDVITLDVEMPEMDGITTLSEIMRTKPRPVVMLSSLTKQGADKTFESIELGAVDFIAKPSGSISLDIKEIETEIVTKVLQAANANINSMSKVQTQVKYGILEPELKNDNRYIIGIGTSTGGPRALQQVLTRLPKNIPAPVVIVQHMPPGFTDSLAKRLNQMSHITVCEAKDGEYLEKGVAYIAPGGCQFRVIETVKGLRTKITKEETRNGHQPSVEVLFESLTKLTHDKIIAVMMTGMGSDGAESLIEMKEKKNDTVIISEAEKTCVVYGMPRAAEKTNLVDFVVELPDISDVIVNQLKIRGE